MAQKNAKRKFQKKWLVLLLPALFLLGAGILFFNKLQPSHKKEVEEEVWESTESANEQLLKLIKDEENDGFYKSYLHGVTFSYPENIFTRQFGVQFREDKEDKYVEEVCWANEDK